MKKIFFILPMLLLFINAKNPVTDDLLSYINTELPKVAKYEEAAIDAYDSVSGDNYTDDDDMYEALIDVVLPNYRKLVNGIEAITIKLKTKQVRKLNEKYVEAANTQLNAFTLLEIMLRTQNGDRMVEYNERLDKGRRLIREWQIELNDLCEKNGVELN